MGSQVSTLKYLRLQRLSSVECCTASPSPSEDGMEKQGDKIPRIVCLKRAGFPRPIQGLGLAGRPVFKSG